MASPSSNNNDKDMDSVVVPNKGLFKSVMCRFYNKKNGCNNGAECKFAHGKSEIKTGAVFDYARLSHAVESPVEKQSDAESLRASPLFACGVDMDGDDLVPVPVGGTVAEVATKAALTASVTLPEKAATGASSSVAMHTDFVEKNSSATAVPKPIVVATDSEVDKWPVVGDGTVVKGHLKRTAHSAPGSVSPGTGGTNPRRGQSARSGNSTPDNASPGSSVFNSRTESDTPSEWITKRGGKFVSPNSVADTTTPLKLNMSGYPIIAAVPGNEKRGKRSALFGALIPSPTSNLFQALATDNSANMDH